MSIKMAELMKQTGETRSTLLFYVKEGLLQEPKKPKPNVHLYANDSVERVRMIKTLQNQLHYTITQIKQVFNDNQFDFNNGVDVLLQKLDLFAGIKQHNYKTIEDALKIYDLTEWSLDFYIKEGIIEIHNGYFNDNSWKLLQILSDLKSSTKSRKLLLAYVKSAKELASLEFELGSELIQRDETNNAQELFLDLVLTLKPSIFNLQTKLEHKRKTNA